ncbi:N-acetylmuramoyl-L-alanine amidase [Dactylosporangium sp. NPDC051484]|uniref:N-acetylmuramoyl-L-alanine amidase n=1 Tax=Dactylosporangium sp. NPDC051484 TaxID=3154942 RepID=UPI00344B1D87
MGPTRIPGIAYAALPKAGGQISPRTLAWPPRLIVIHDTGNNSSTRFDEASFAANRTDARDRWTSAHAYIDPGGPLGSLPLSLQAWAAYSYANENGFHLEMCRKASGVETATIAHTTALVRELCDLAGIPKVKLTPAQVAAGARGICGHYDITIGLKKGDHTDPGPDFNWAGFMAQVNQKATTANTEDDMTPEEHSAIIAGGLTDENVLHFRLRSTQDADDPALARYYNKLGWGKPVGLKQISDKLDKLSGAAGGAPSQAQLDAAVLAAMRDPEVQAGLGRAIIAALKA